jgi:hypothetical protein
MSFRLKAEATGCLPRFRAFRLQAEEQAEATGCFGRFSGFRLQAEEQAV